LLPTPDETKCPTDVCIICQGLHGRSGPRLRKFPRIDSTRRHLIDQHLKRLAKGVPVYCTWDTCETITGFADAMAFLNHAATAHDYDLKIRPRQLGGFLHTETTEFIAEIDGMTDVTTMRTVSDIGTPASSTASDIRERIDPILLKGGIEV
jgi:hypothetical protein